MGRSILLSSVVCIIYLTQWLGLISSQPSVLRRAGLFRGDGLGFAQRGGFGIPDGSGTARRGGFGISQPSGFGGAQPGGFGTAPRGGFGISQPSGFGTAQPVEASVGTFSAGGSGIARRGGFGTPGGSGTARRGGFGISQPSGFGGAQPGGFGTAPRGGFGISQPSGFGTAQPVEASVGTFSAGGSGIARRGGFGTPGGSGTVRRGGFGISQPSGLGRAQPGGFGTARRGGFGISQSSGFGTAQLVEASVGTFSARQLADTARLVAPTVETSIAALDSVDRSAFNAGIDRIRVARTEHAGPHLLTTNAAREIERAGRAFLQTAAETSTRLSIPAASIRGMLEGAGVQAPTGFRCPFHPSTWPTCDSATRYRTPDGSCNNLDNPLWGRSQTPFERFQSPVYDDGFSSPRTRSSDGGTLPNARLISREFHQNLPNPLPDLNHLTMEWGQFLSHDIEFTALSTGYLGSRLDCCAMPDRHNCFPIQIPPGDPFFPASRTCINMVRAIPTPNLECTIGVRQHLNQISHYHDGSQVYGSDKEEADGLRTFTNGLLKTSGIDDLLPTASGSDAGCISSSPSMACFRAGDVRVNQQPALIAIHTIFVREHNRLARRLAEVNPTWLGDDETLYQEARRILVAMTQHITYNEYLPEILGSSTMSSYGLNPRASGYFHGYNSAEKPMIRNAYSSAAGRFGHSMIFHRMPTHDGSSLTTNQLLKDVFLKPDLVYTHGVGEVTRGLTRSPSQSVDRHVTEQVTRHLFERSPGFGGDLAAINIQRARDRGIPNYQTWRRHCSLFGQYSHSNSVRNQLQNIYRSPDDMDLFTAGVSEIPLPDAKVGPTFACLIGQQLASLKTGDRFYYENSGSTSFTPAQLAEIRKVTLANIICRSTDIDAIQKRALRNIMPGNSAVNCRYIQDIDLAPWAGGCTPVNGGWSSWQRTPCFGKWRLRYRLCNNPTPNECGRRCSASFQIRVESCGFSINLPFPRFNTMSRASGQLPVDTVQISAVTSQVEAALSGLINSGSTNIDPSVFERAISSVSSNSSPPQRFRGSRKGGSLRKLVRPKPPIKRRGSRRGGKGRVLARPKPPIKRWGSRRGGKGRVLARPKPPIKRWGSRRGGKGRVLA